MNNNIKTFTDTHGISESLELRFIRQMLTGLPSCNFPLFMKAYWWILFFLVCFNTIMVGQNHEIEGRVFHEETREPIPYTNIYNQSLNKGTISNTDGYFRIPIKDMRDSVRISFIGFKDQFINLRENEDFYTILLEENMLQLEEVTIKPKDYSYLYTLLRACRKSASKMEKTSRAYYELKSTIDSDQIELVEGYYNADIRGYALQDIHLKAGRVALQPYENRFFASLESSRAILMLNILTANDYFPNHPLAMTRSKLKRNYHLSLESKYLDGDKDSVYVVGYIPRDTSDQLFEGRIWVNKSKNQIIKIIYNCSNALNHPFLPMFPSDSISNVSFGITQTFKNIDNQAIFNHIDFEYEIAYKSRIGKSAEQRYSIRTNAVLYAYNYEKAFFIPAFDFNDQSTGDYRKINALPYNEFFWTYHDEYRLQDSLNTNESFFADSKSLTNKTLFKSNTFSEEGLFEHPYVRWSPARIKFREILPDTSVQRTASTGIRAEQYNLDVKIYMDINSYKDSTHIVTAAIFDPYESYYHLPMDNKTHCFVNMYFDLCEIKRRELEAHIFAKKDDLKRVMEVYETFLEELESWKFEFLKAVQRGTDESGMIKYNDIVVKELGINNIKLFQPFGIAE